MLFDKKKIYKELTIASKDFKKSVSLKDLLLLFHTFRHLEQLQDLLSAEKKKKVNSSP